MWNLLKMHGSKAMMINFTAILDDLCGGGEHAQADSSHKFDLTPRW